MSTGALAVKVFEDEESKSIRDTTQYEIAGQQHDRSSDTAKDYNMSKSGGVEITTTQRMVSATWGSVLTSLLVTPLDVVRVRLQSQNPTPTLSPLNISKFPGYQANFQKLPPDLGVKACCKEVFWLGDNGQFCLASNAATVDSAAAGATECAVEETQRRTFNSTLDGLRKIAKNEGPTTLWRGLSPTLVMAIPANVIYFTGYDWLRYNHASPIQKYTNDTYNPLISGSIARVMAAVAVSPVEMFRTRMQSSQAGTSTIFKDTLTDMQRMVQTQGVTSLWRGLTLTMWRDVPFSGFYWWGYEALRHEIRKIRDDGTAGSNKLIPSAQQQMQRHQEDFYTTFVDSFAAGSIAGATAAFITTPFDVGKTRQQVFRHAGDDGVVSSSGAKSAVEAAGKVAPEEMSMPRFLYHILKEEGTSGLFKGWAARCLKVAPACAIMISSYELGKRWAHGKNSKKPDGENGNA